MSENSQFEVHAREAQSSFRPNMCSTRSTQCFSIVTSVTKKFGGRRVLGVFWGILGGFWSIFDDFEGLFRYPAKVGLVGGVTLDSSPRPEKKKHCNEPHRRVGRDLVGEERPVADACLLEAGYELDVDRSVRADANQACRRTVG